MAIDTISYSTGAGSFIVAPRTQLKIVARFATWGLLGLIPTMAFSFTYYRKSSSKWSRSGVNT